MNIDDFNELLKAVEEANDKCVEFLAKNMVNLDLDASYEYGLTIRDVVDEAMADETLFYGRTFSDIQDFLVWSSDKNNFIEVNNWDFYITVKNYAYETSEEYRGLARILHKAGLDAINAADKLGLPEWVLCRIKNAIGDTYDIR